MIIIILFNYVQPKFVYSFTKIFIMGNIVNSEPYQWKDEYTVNITVIDEQHKKFLSIINDLKLIINGKSCKEKVSDIFFQLAYLIDYYFLKEEIYFNDLKYPNFDHHKKQHNLFIDRVIQFQKDLENNKPDLCLEIYQYLENWFDEHILKYDKEAVEYLKNGGVK
ncbi:MAG TPA: hypothetical protein DCG75_15125 [Bacteroidales bacterium]|nr:hypothetical protein [Bacteroidales bacterium]